MTNVNERLRLLLHVRGSTCPICERTSWEIGRIYDDSKLRYAGPTEAPPKSQDLDAVCGGCGYVLRFKTKNLMAYDL
jgi:hypothetical protein